MVKTEPGANKEDHDQLVEDIDNPEDNYGDDSHQGGDDTFGADDTYGAGGADDIGFEGDEGGAGPSEIGKVHKAVARLRKNGKVSAVWNFFTKVSPEQAVCNMCGDIYATSGGNTSGLRKHLIKAHDWEADYVSPKKNISKRNIQRSYVWKFCSKLSNAEATCNICNAKIPTSGNTTNLRNHLKNFHHWDGKEDDTSVNVDITFEEKDNLS